MNENNSVETQVTTAETMADTNTAASDTTPKDDFQLTPELETKLERMAQSIADKSTASLGKKLADAEKRNSDLQKNYDKLKNEHLSSEQKAQLEREQQMAEFEEQKRAFLEEKNRFTAANALKEFGLDDGTLESNELLPLIMADTEDGIKAKAKALGAFAQKCKDTATKQFFDGNRHIPPKGGDPSPSNPQLDAVKQLGEEAGKRAERSKAIRDNFLNRK